METLEILKKHQLRYTETRESILQGFLSNPSALSHHDIEQILLDGFDRVTIYRTLKKFVDLGILHKILDDEGGMKYALCDSNNCNTEQHHHDHVHFKCSHCGHTTCLGSVLIPKFELPKGYTRTDVNMLVQGVCFKCENL